jgi:hypothetical protein
MDEDPTFFQFPEDLLRIEGKFGHDDALAMFSVSAFGGR